MDRPESLAFALEALELIPANSEEGSRLLREATTADHGPLLRWFEGQERPTFCSVASSVITLNALLGRDAHDQDAFFIPAVSAVRHEDQVAIDGMTLAQLGEALSHHGARVTIHHASDLTLEQFRALAIENLRRSGDFLIVNYRREALGQTRGGHFSPLGAWHEATDRFLVLDVADYKYPPVWVPAAVLFAGMVSVDDASGRTRGYLTVSLAPELP